MHRSRVDLPHPDGPTMLTSSPSATLRDTPSMATWAASPCPYVRVRSVTSSTSVPPRILGAQAPRCHAAVFYSKVRDLEKTRTGDRHFSAQNGPARVENPASERT